MTEPLYNWAVGTRQTIQPKTWTTVLWPHVAQNYTGVQFLQDGKMFFPARPEGWFGDIYANVAWDDSQGPGYAYKRSVRIVAQEAAPGSHPVISAARTDAMYVPNQGQAYSAPGEWAFFHPPVSLQPGYAPDVDVYQWVEVWHNAAEPQDIMQVPNLEEGFACPLLMFNDLGAFEPQP